ncbi:MAG UNVERIFIED_CONTAM: LCP family protein [Anaerolineae bacterium]
MSLLSGSLLTLADGREIVVESWDGTSRFTILVMGLDRRPGESGLQYRTDTMMLVSLDPQTNSVGILSIPRDLYVSVPGYATLQRINTPMASGELQCEGCGPNLAMQTAQNNLGIRVNEFIAVDFSAFINFVDLIGGIDVTTTYTINDPAYPNMYYGYNPFYLVAGDHHLDGVTALKFARTRHGSSDFERALRQQEVLYGHP